MADNVSVTPGTGSSIATDDIGGVQYQRVKMVLGADGVNGGDVAAANPMPMKLTDGTNAAAIVAADGVYGLVIVTPGHVSTANSTTAVLSGGATFTGTWEDTINHGVVQVSIIASHASASSGFVVQYSSDGTNVDNSDTYTISAGVGKLYSFQAGARYIRIVYTNGGTLQTSFRLQTIMKPVYAKPSSHRAGDQMSLEDDVEAVKSVIAGESTSGGGSLINVKVSPSGTLQTDAAVSAVVPGTGATNLGKAEDAAHTSGDVGVLGLAVRNDTGT